MLIIYGHTFVMRCRWWWCCCWFFVIVSLISHISNHFRCLLSFLHQRREKKHFVSVNQCTLYLASEWRQNQHQIKLQKWKIAHRSKQQKGKTKWMLCEFWLVTKHTSRTAHTSIGDEVIAVNCMHRWIDNVLLNTVDLTRMCACVFECLRYFFFPIKNDDHLFKVD